MLTTPRLAWVPMGAFGALLALAYAVLLGGTALGELSPLLRLLNACVATILVGVYVAKAPSGADRVDRAVLLALILIIAAGALSRFPRQSLDAVLAALTYAAATFIARGILREESTRKALLGLLMVLSFVITFTTAARWLPLGAEWWALNEWRVIPPLDLNLSAAPWGHRHDVTLLVAMLYPSWWVGRPGPVRAALGTVVGMLAIPLVVIDGSRTLWLALAVATAGLIAPLVYRRLRTNGRARWVLAGGALLLTGLVIISGVGDAMVDRLFNLSTLSARSAMWGPLTEAWLARPIAGWGPGAFPWILQQTDYFDLQTWAPRHPDSVVFQLLPETGLLGVAALVFLAIAIVPPLARSSSAGARWALIVFAVAGVGANPTDFAFLIAIAIAWVGLALPRTSNGEEIGERPTKVMRIATMIAGATIGVAYIATLGAAFSYAGAKGAAEKGDLEGAVTQFSVAIGLDPGMALYWRQRGTAHLLRGDHERAAEDLREAAELNPSDDLAWRSLALAYEADGDDAAASDAIDHAVEAQRSDPTNLLLKAALALKNDREGLAIETLSEVVQAWPAILATPAWRTTFESSGVSNQGMIAAAARRVERGLPAPDGNAILLAVIADREDEWIVDAGPESVLPLALAASYRCQLAVDDFVTSVPDGERRSIQYWEVIIRGSSFRSEPTRRSKRVFEIMTNGRLGASGASRTLDPLRENNTAGFSADAWGYRRPPIAWPPYPRQLPSFAAGTERWLVDPGGAARTVDGHENSSACDGSG